MDKLMGFRIIRLVVKVSWINFIHKIANHTLDLFRAFDHHCRRLVVAAVM